MEVFKLQFRGFSLPQAEIVIQSGPKYDEAMDQIWNIGATPVYANQSLKSRKNVTLGPKKSFFDTFSIVKDRIIGLYGSNLQVIFTIPRVIVYIHMVIVGTIHIGHMDP